MGRNWSTYKLVPVSDSKGRRIKNLYLRNGEYYLSAQVAGKRYLRRVPHDTRTDAVAWIKSFLRAARAGRSAALDESKARSDYPTLGRIYDLYREAGARQYALDGKPLPMTIRNSISSLSLVVSSVHGVAAPEGLSTSLLTADLAERYVMSVVASAGDDEMMIERRRVSASSTLRQAKSVFTRWARAYYGRHVVLPASLDGFLAAGKSVKAPRYRLPPEDLRRRTLEAAAALQTSDPEMYAAFCMAYDLGMRSGEIQAARWEWLEPAGDAWCMHICRRPYWRGAKNLVDHSPPVSKEVYAALQAIRRPDDEYILPGGHPTARRDRMNRDFSAWMRSIGWDRATYPKAAHELRKLAGSMWYTHAGLQWAARWLGDTAATVDHYYSDLVASRAPVLMR